MNAVVKRLPSTSSRLLSGSMRSRMQDGSNADGGCFVTAKEMMDRFPMEEEEIENRPHPKSAGLFEVDSQGRFVEKREEEQEKSSMSMRELVFQTAREMHGGIVSTPERSPKKVKSGSSQGKTLLKEVPKAPPISVPTAESSSEDQKRKHLRELLQKQQAMKAEALAQKKEDDLFKHQISVQRSARLRSDEPPPGSRKRSASSLPM